MLKFARLQQPRSPQVKKYFFFNFFNKDNKVLAMTLGPNIFIFMAFLIANCSLMFLLRDLIFPMCFYMIFRKIRYYKPTGRKRPRGIKDRSPIFYLLELIKEVKIRISRNAFLHWIEIYLKFSNLYTIFRLKCVCVHVK